MPAPRIAIVTDSTSDIPASEATRLGITVVPLNVHFGDEVLLDGVTVKGDEFYRRLQAGGAFPKTSQPSAGAFADAYRGVIAGGAEAILSIHISSKVSGTCNSANQAKAELGGNVPIEVIDTLQASMGLGLIAMEVARAAAAGLTASDAASLARQLMGSTRFFGMVETLEYLQRGGRIGRAQMLLGSLLKVHPILTMQDGVAHPLERPRTRTRALDRMRAIAEGAIPLRALSVLYSTQRQDGEALASQLKAAAPAQGITVAQFGPVLGTYLGPGAVGVALIQATPS
jgi:DegV family protein with EDD domain